MFLAAGATYLPQMATNCLTCLGHKHAETAFVDGSCPHWKNMTMATLRSRLSFLIKEVVTSDVPRAGLSGIHKSTSASTEGNMRATTGAFPPGQSPRTSRSSSCLLRPVELPDEFKFAS